MKTYSHISTLPELLDEDKEDICPHFHISTLPELLDEDKEDIFPHFHTSTLPELLDKDNEDIFPPFHISTLPELLDEDKDTGRPPSVSGGRCWLKSEQRSLLFIEEIHINNTVVIICSKMQNLKQDNEWKEELSCVT